MNITMIVILLIGAIVYLFAVAMPLYNLCTRLNNGPPPHSSYSERHMLHADALRAVSLIYTYKKIVQKTIA